ncbi:unnamed protein product [Paramecium primaurelia]|uniref:Transmembrane protein n=1 Tax=Paramecium primaurelia TaxID=5886 RepID=A0A8S1NTI0_PARPR|nr:unnamed protein product [Paramecium primaurelia]
MFGIFKGLSYTILVILCFFNYFINIVIHTIFWRKHCQKSSYKLHSFNIILSFLWIYIYNYMHFYGIKSETNGCLGNLGNYFFNNSFIYDNRFCKQKRGFFENGGYYNFWYIHKKKNKQQKNLIQTQSIKT